MKTKILTVLFCLGVPGYLLAQSFTEKITRELSFEKKSPANAVLVANINGDVKVQGYEGDKVLLEVTKTINGKTDSRLENGKKEIQLGVIDRADTLIFFVEGDCNQFQKSSSHHREDNGGWGYQWNNCNGGGGNCRKDYDYKMDFTLKVPYAVNLVLSTINNGDIAVTSMKGAVDANNINGSIKLSNVVREVNAHTINGNVDVDYARNPDKASRFYTLNGDINANFRKGLGASLSFESFNGSFYTNVDQLESMPVALEKKQQGNGGFKYKLNGNRFKVGGGGVDLDFETFNGNLYLKEIN